MVLTREGPNAHLAWQQAGVGQTGVLLHQLPQYDAETVDITLLAETGTGQHLSRSPRQSVFYLLFRTLLAIEEADQLSRRGQTDPEYLNTSTAGRYEMSTCSRLVLLTA